MSDEPLLPSVSEPAPEPAPAPLNGEKHKLDDVEPLLHAVPKTKHKIDGFEKLAEAKQILIMEGSDKLIESVQARVPDCMEVITWPIDAIEMSDVEWRPLFAKNVVLWPADTDGMGMDFSNEIGRCLVEDVEKLQVVDVNRPAPSDDEPLRDWLAKGVKPWVDPIDAKPKKAAQKPAPVPAPKPRTKPQVEPKVEPAADDSLNPEWLKIEGAGTDLSVARLFLATPGRGEEWCYVQSLTSNGGRWLHWDKTVWADSSGGKVPPITRAIESLEAEIQRIIDHLSPKSQELEGEFDELVKNHPFGNGMPRTVRSNNPAKGLDPELKRAVEDKLQLYRFSAAPEAGWLKALQRVRSARGQADIETVLRNHLHISIEMLNANPHVATFPAGLGQPAVRIDFAKIGFREIGSDPAKVQTELPRREDYSTMVAGGPWKPGAFDDTIEDIWCHVFSNDEGERNFDSELTFDQLIGMAMAGRTETHSIPSLHGQGGTGKSQLTAAAAYAFGDYAVEVKAKALSETKAESSHDRDLVRIHRKRFILVPEVSKYIHLGATAKALSGGDSVPMANAYGKSEFPVVLEGIMFLVGNEPPSTSPTDEGMWRRLKRIPCEHRVPESELGLDLKARYQTPEAAAAVIQRAFIGLCKYHESDPPRLVISDAIRDATSAQREESDPLPAWHDACVITVAPDSFEFANSRVTTADLWLSYAEFARKRGVRSQYSTIAEFSKAFKHTFGDRYPAWRGNSERGYKGLRLIQSVSSDKDGRVHHNPSYETQL